MAKTAVERSTDVVARLNEHKRADRARRIWRRRRGAAAGKCWPRTPPVGGFTDFDPVASLPWAMAIGRAWASDAVLTRIDVGRVATTGAVDLSGEQSSGYRFASPGRHQRWINETDAGSKPVTATGLMLQIKGTDVSALPYEERAEPGAPAPVSLPLAAILERRAAQPRVRRQAGTTRATCSTCRARAGSGTSGRSPGRPACPGFAPATAGLSLPLISCSAAHEEPQDVPEQQRDRGEQLERRADVRDSRDSGAARSTCRRGSPRRRSATIATEKNTPSSKPKSAAATISTSARMPPHVRMPRMNEKSLRVTKTTAVRAAKATTVVSAAAGSTPGIRRLRDDQDRHEDQPLRDDVAAEGGVLQRRRGRARGDAARQPAGHHEPAQDQQPRHAQHPARDRQRQAGVEQEQLEGDEARPPPGTGARRCGGGTRCGRPRDSRITGIEDGERGVGGERHRRLLEGRGSCLEHSAGIDGVH